MKMRLDLANNSSFKIQSALGSHDVDLQDSLTSSLPRNKMKKRRKERTKKEKNPVLPARKVMTE